MPVVPMFPLGAVLFPAMPLHLQVFEPRYLQMLMELIRDAGTGESETGESGETERDIAFGVVLIERGREVGGGDRRFDTGTLAQVTDVDATGGLVRLAAHGSRRFVVREWLPDEPYPRAEIEELPELIWEQRLEPLRQETEALVRRVLAQGSEFREGLYPADLELSADPIAAVWQLAGIAPVGELDQVRLLRSTSTEALLQAVRDATEDAAIGFRAD